LQVAETSDDEEVRLSAAGLTLRPWRPGDEAALVRFLNDPDVERFMNVIPVPYSEADARAWVHELAPAARAAGGAEFALDLGDGLAIGSLGVRREERADGPVGVVGYWVARTARGHGLAGMALRLAAPWAATYLGLRRQELVHDLENVSSCHTAIAAGFKVDALLPAGAKHRDGTPRDIERHTWTSGRQT
jgi:RimJ/RimL family protein N-acetyltransferase